MINFKYKLKHILGLAIILAINSMVYAPSLFHMARADQVTYLVETAELNSFSDILRYSYSYPRTRTMDPGDQLLYRPLFYFFLSLQKYVFGCNFFLWQLLTLGLHFVLICQVLRLLRHISQNNFSYLFVLAFSLLFISSEMVLWHHINGYLLFLIFVLNSIYASSLYVADPKKNQNQLAVFLLFIFGACYTYEYGALCNVILAGLLVAFMRDKKWVAFNREILLRGTFQAVITFFLLSMPAGCYLVSSMLDYFWLTGPHTFAGVSGPSFSPIVFFWGFLKSFATYLLAIICPLFMRLDTTTLVKHSLQMPDAVFIQKQMLLHPFLALINLSLCIFLIAVAFFFIFRGGEFKKNFLARSRQKQIPATIKKMFLLNSSIILLITYAGVIVSSRMLARGPEYLLYSTYHFYVISVFALIVAYVLFIKIYSAWDVGKKFIKIGVAFILFLLIILNGYSTFRFNRSLEKKDLYYSTMISAMDNFCRDHRQEKDFSFFLLFKEETRLLRIRWQPDHKESFLITGELAALLFRKYLNPTSPKYVLVFTKSAGLRAFRHSRDAASWLKQEGKIF